MKTFILISSFFMMWVTLNVTGSYNTDFGILKLKQDKSNVSGTYSYPYNGETVNGSLKGTLKEQVLTFTWEQKQGAGKSGGTGSFTFSKNGKSFTGTWIDSKGQKGSWNGGK
jgi:hypothetical protein